MKRLHCFTILLSMLALSGCKVGPDYCPPCPEAPQHFASSDVAPLQNSNEDLAVWWEVFGDPQLTSYIEIGARNNYDIKIALMNICRARAAKTMAASKLYPTLDADMTYSRNSLDLFSTGGIGGGPVTQLNELKSDAGLQIFFAGVIKSP